MKFHRDILHTQIRQLFTQLVANGDVNTPFPITGRTDNWAGFYWGSPDACREDWQSPMFFVYDMEYTEGFQNLDHDRLTATMILGLQAKCTAIQGLENEFETLWMKTKRLFSKNYYAIPLTGNYTLTGPDGHYRTITGGTLATMGIGRAQLLGSLPLYIDGKIKRYIGQLELDLYFNTAPTEVTAPAVITYT